MAPPTRPRAPRRRGAHQSMMGLAGTSVDMYGGPVIDPTENVKALNEATNKRTDDLRLALEQRANDLRTALEKRADDLRIAHEKSVDRDIAHVKDLQRLDRDYVKMLADVYRDHSREMDKFRAESVEAAAERAQIAIQALAASKAAANLEFSTRIAALERIAAESKGKEAVSDPQIGKLIDRIDSLSSSRERTEGMGKGVQITGGLIMGVFTVLSLIGGGMIYVLSTRAQTAPQFMYIPTPPAAQAPLQPVPK